VRFLPEGKIRVYELAKALGLSTSKVMTLLGDLGVKVTDQTALVDAALETRLKGLIRRPGVGGRGMAAIRPEPTWLTSIRWPKPPREEPEEPGPEPEPVAPLKASASAGAAPAAAAVAKAPLPGTRASGAAAAAVSDKPVPPASGSESPAAAVRRATPAGADKEADKEAKEAKEAVREAVRPIKHRVASPEESPPPAAATPATGVTARPAEKAFGPTLPSGRTPTPPPPPLPVRRGPERAPSSPASRPAAAPPSRSGPAPAAPAGAGPARVGAAGGGPAKPAAQPAPAAPSRAAHQERQPAAGPVGPGPTLVPATGPAAHPARAPGRPYSTPAAPAGRPTYDRPRGPAAGPAAGLGTGAGGAARGAEWAAAPRPSAPREWPSRPGSVGPVGRPGPGRGRESAGVPGPVPAGKAAAAPRRDRRGQGGVPSRGKAARPPIPERAWRNDEEAERRLIRGRQGGRKQRTVKTEEPVRVRATEVVIDGPLTVRELAERMGLTGAELIKSLIRLGIVASLNQVLDPESARVAVEEMGVKVLTGTPRAAGEEGEGAAGERPPAEEEGEALEPRPPVVTVMGHVDHGKTSLLDAIRKTNVTAGEAGGITQHIGASTVEWRGKKIVFLDTPGHEAFTAMRARGAQVTDIAVLVVAADDGVMPQTLEAIDHARAAKVPIIVALNKMDKPNALPDRVKKQLAEKGLTPEEWGGDTIVVPVSAKERTGIDELLDMIILVAEMAELRADPRRRAKGIVIETRLDKGLGPVATVLVQNGTLRVGDPVVAGTAFGRIRAMVDDKGERVEEAGPSTPVEVTGLDELPEAGDVFQVLADEKMAREIAAQRDLKRREREMGGTRAPVSLAELFEQAKEGERKQVNLVLKADVQGSLEALRQSFEKLEEPDIGINIIHTGVGGVSENDVMLASASGAIIIAFNVTPDAGARQAAERQKVDIRTYRVIYDAINDVKAAVKGLRAPTYREVVHGHAEVRQLFRIPKVGIVAGCYVTDGKIARKNRLRVVRDGVIVHEGAIASLKHVKDDVRDVSAGFECGIGLENFQDIKEGDILEAFSIEEVAS